jgi:hypothetical protein
MTSLLPFVSSPEFQPIFRMFSGWENSVNLTSINNLELKMQISHTTVSLVPKGPQGHLGADIKSKRGHADRILVERTEDGWKPVSESPGEIGRKDLSANFAMWKDREVIDKDSGDWQNPPDVLRPKDGQVQSDEISHFGLEGPHNAAVKGSVDPVSGAWLDSGITLGTELVAGLDGLAFHTIAAETNWNDSFSTNNLNGPLTEFAQNDLNWNVGS